MSSWLGLGIAVPYERVAQWYGEESNVPPRKRIASRFRNVEDNTQCRTVSYYYTHDDKIQRFFASKFVGCELVCAGGTVNFHDARFFIVVSAPPTRLVELRRYVLPDSFRDAYVRFGVAESDVKFISL